MLFCPLLALLPLLLGSSSALSAAQWRSQSIYQVLTDRFARTDGSVLAPCDFGSYCGGTFQGLMNKLDYIQGMGFTAVWISPVVANLNTMTPYGLPYHGYWAQNFYQINPHFGTAADLKALSAALHARHMYLMVDIVTNHVGYNGPPASVNYSTFKPFNKQSYYHSYCRIDYDNITSIQGCWTGDTTVSLPDLRTEDPIVQKMFRQWISELVSNYSIDGLRLDSVQQVNKPFFPTFVSASGVYAMGEVLNGSPDYLCDYQNYIPGMLDYATYFWLIRAFSAPTRTLAELANGVSWLQHTCADTTLMGNFMENQDNPRWPALTNDSSLTANALAYTILRDGIPIVYYGQEQGFSGGRDPYNREPLWPSGSGTTTTLYKYIARLNAIRYLAISMDSNYITNRASVAYSDAHTLVLRKGGDSPRVISIFTNSGYSSGIRLLTLSSSWTGYSANTAYTDLLSCTTYTTDEQGSLNVTIAHGMPIALYRTQALSDSTICASSSSPSQSSSILTPKTSTTTSTSQTTPSISPSVLPTTTSTYPKTSSTAPSTTISKPTATTSRSLTTSLPQTSPPPTIPTPYPKSTIPTCPESNNTVYYSPSSSFQFLIECDTDFPSNDMTSLTTPTFMTCLKNCAAKQACVGATYIGTECRMKSGVNGGVSRKGVWGAVVFR